jgi:putative glutamine amidotransferase
MVINPIRRLVISFILILLLFSCAKQTQRSAQTVTTIGIINPNVQTLEAFRFFVQSGLLKIPDVSFIAICYDQVERDLHSLEKYIQTQNEPLFRLKIVSGELGPQSIFRKNALSAQFHDLFSQTDGLFFLGGADIPPAVYEQKTSLLTSITTPKRHLFELSFLFHLLGGYQDSTDVPFLQEKHDYKIIGFCLGMQTLNVATGGSMYQDIPAEIYGRQYVEDVLALEVNEKHRNYWQDLDPQKDMIWSNFHQIRSVKNHSFFDEAMWSPQEMPFVYSSHHQAVRQTGKDLEILATSTDGKIVEIIAHKIYKNVLGVQFHPEVAALYKSDGDKMKWFPDDTQPRSYNEFLTQTNSLEFHKKFWGKVSSLYTRK